MKYLAIAMTALILALGSQAAFARDHGNGHGYGGHGYGGHGYGHSSYIRPYYGSRHGHHNSHNAEYLIGGLALGAILTSSYYRTPRYIESGYYETQRAVSYPAERIVYRSAAPAVAGRRLLRDLEGRCWEKQLDDRGDELRIELPAEECDW